MKNQFADYETAIMLNELDVKLSEDFFFDYHGKIFHHSIRKPSRTHYKCDAPLWQQVEQWLWEKHKIFIEIEDISGEEIEFELSVWQNMELINVLPKFDSPITAKQTGINQAVKYLYGKHNK